MRGGFGKDVGLPQLSDHRQDDGDGEQGEGHRQLGEPVGKRDESAGLR